MTRLIDGDALIELINGGYDLDFDEVPETKRELLRMIMEQPTVDAVRVIKCKDCKHFEADLDGMTMYCANEIMPTVFVCTGQGYCSEAERKEE